MNGGLLLNSSSVFCTAKYRGGVRRTEGLENIGSNSNSNSNKSGITLSPAVPRNITGCFR